MRVVLLLFSYLGLTSAACVRYECSLDFDHSKHHSFDEHGTIADPDKDKPVFVCQNYPYLPCGPGEAKCGGHCINMPGTACEDNSDCVESEKPPPAPVPVQIPVLAEYPVPFNPGPVSEVCWDVSWEKKEECSSKGDGTGQCYSSRGACYKAGGETFLEGYCGHMPYYQHACGCCLWASVPVETEDEGTDREHHWPTPQPTGCCPQFELTDRQIMVILFLLYLLLNALLILISRCCMQLVRGRRKGRGNEQQRNLSADTRGSYSRVEDGSLTTSAENRRAGVGDDDIAAPGGGSDRHRRGVGDPSIDCCTDFEWWEGKTWAWLLVEALVLPCAVLSLCWQCHRKPARQEQIG